MSEGVMPAASTASSSSAGPSLRGGSRHGAISPSNSLHNPSQPTTPVTKLRVNVGGGNGSARSLKQITPRQSRYPATRITSHPASPTQSQSKSSTRTGTRTRSNNPTHPGSDNHNTPSSSVTNGGVKGTGNGDDDSDLTPQSSDGEDNAEERLSRISADKGKGKQIPRRIGVGSRGNFNTPTPTKKGASSSHSGVKAAANLKSKAVGTSGPAGRERKKAVKAGTNRRKRARDAKLGEGSSEYQQPQGSLNGDRDTTPTRRYADDGNSSFGDDESDHTISHELLDDGIDFPLPEGYEGYEMEDLGLGVGAVEAEVERQFMNAEGEEEWWYGLDLHEEEEEEDEDESEGMRIDHLSGSEMDQKSQSSAGNSDVNMDDFIGDDDEDGGYSQSSASEGEGSYHDLIAPEPMGPLTSIFPFMDNEVEDNASQYTLMQDFRGEWSLVSFREDQPEASGSRGRRRTRGGPSQAGSRAGTTAGSVSGRTNTSSADQGQLVIDADGENPYDDDDTSSVESGWTDLDNQSSGDTTDSMDEDDMPQLDTPAIQEFINQRIAQDEAAALAAVSRSLMEVSANAGTPVEEGDVQMMAPTIVITDTSLPEGATLEMLPAEDSLMAPQNKSSDVNHEGQTASLVMANGATLSSDTSAFPLVTSTIAPEVAATLGSPQTPHKKGPRMGLFYPKESPSRRAIVDGHSKVFSPFTHPTEWSRQTRSTSNVPDTPTKSKDGNASSVGASGSKSGSGSGPGSRSASASAHVSADTRRRRRSSATDIFSPRHPTQDDLDRKIKKKNRFVSIPGHPKFLKHQKRLAAIAAFEAAQAAANADIGNLSDTPSSEEELLSLDNLIELSGLTGEMDSDEETPARAPHSHRFDAVMGQYLMRNINLSAGRARNDVLAGHHQGHGPGAGHAFSSSPIGMRSGNPQWLLAGGNEMLAGPSGSGSRMLISPVLEAMEPFDEDITMSRRERRHRRRGRGGEMERLEI